MWTWHGYNVVDGLVVLFLGAGLLGGIRRGFSGELVRALIAVAAAAAAVLYARPVSEWAMLHANLSVRAALIGAFIVVFFGAYLAVTFVRVMLGKLADFRFKGPLERIGGALCGLARAAGVSGLILLLLGLAPNDNLQRLVVDESVAGRFVTQHLRPLYSQLSERVPEIQVEEPATEVYGVPLELLDEAGVTSRTEEVEYVLPGQPLPGELQLP
jgi:uncharacterized membrane protein required for colicin V production